MVSTPPLSSLAKDFSKEAFARSRGQFRCLAAFPPAPGSRGPPPSGARTPSLATRRAAFPLTGPVFGVGPRPKFYSRDAARDCGKHATPVLFRRLFKGLHGPGQVRCLAAFPPAPGSRVPPTPGACSNLPSRRLSPRGSGSASGHVPVLQPGRCARCGKHATPASSAISNRGKQPPRHLTLVGRFPKWRSWPPPHQHQAPVFRLPPASRGRCPERPFPSRVRLRRRATSRNLQPGRCA
jgi:hypothetical protein